MLNVFSLFSSFGPLSLNSPSIIQHLVPNSPVVVGLITWKFGGIDGWMDGGLKRAFCFCFTMGHMTFYFWQHRVSVGWFRGDVTWYETREWWNDWERDCISWFALPYLLGVLLPFSVVLLFCCSVFSCLFFSLFQHVFFVLFFCWFSSAPKKQHHIRLNVSVFKGYWAGSFSSRIDGWMMEDLAVHSLYRELVCVVCVFSCWMG